MNELTRYEQELAKQLQQLPMPDETSVWGVIEQMLDEDDDKIILPPPAKPGCGLWTTAGIIILLLAGGYFGYMKIKDGTDKNTNNVIQKNTSNSSIKQNETKNIELKSIDSKIKPEKNIDNNSNYSTVTSSNIDTSLQKNNSVTFGTDTASSNNKSKFLAGRKDGNVHYKISSTTVEDNSNTVKSYSKQRKKKNNNKSAGLINASPAKIKYAVKQPDIADQIDTNGDENTIVTKNDSLKKSISETTDSNINNIVKEDTVKKKPIDTIAVTKSTTTEKKKKQHYWSAGLALHQQIPLNGEKSNPYNSLGRKISLTDYVPAVYARYNRNKKWFIQSEFRYGAPQQTKNFIYDFKADTSTSSQKTDTTLRLKKMYYHQLPVSFNYYVLPNLSVGIGVVWNKFSSAITEREIIQKDGISPDTTISKVIYKSKNTDSTFSKSYFQLLIEAQYCYKRFTLGARYSRGLQPYIQFTLPGEPVRNEKNNSLQIFLRYELWRSKKK